MKVFFYGSFMDPDHLQKVGIKTPAAVIASLSGHEIYFSPYANLRAIPGKKAWGVLTKMTQPDLDRLYSESFVNSYQPRYVEVSSEGEAVMAVTYTAEHAPEQPPSADYLTLLLKLAARFGFPPDYVDHLRQQRCWQDREFEISTQRSRLQIDRIHHFLSTKAYWCLGIPIWAVERALANSLCFGLYDGELQIGLTRVVTDYATFAYLCDVYVEEEYRGQGLSKWMIECVMETLKKWDLRRICLSTKDAHGLYEKFGLEVTKSPGYWMEIKDNELYQKWIEGSARPVSAPQR